MSVKQGLLALLVEGPRYGAELKTGSSAGPAGRGR